MSKALRLGVLQMPSLHGSGWRIGLKAAARAKGWRVVKGADVPPTNDSPDHSMVILLRDGAQALAMAPSLDACVVISDPLEEICLAVAALYPGKKIKAYAVAAERLAAAVTLVREGACLVEGAAAEADLPLIGRVFGNDSIEVGPPVATLDPGPLDMFSGASARGPEPGHKTNWPWDLFNFRTTPRSLVSPPEVDLTGRARVIFHGPRFSLPAGEWRIRLRFHLDPEDRESPLRFEWGGMDDFEHLELQLKAAGLYEVELTKRWDRPVAAQLRVWAAAAHFVGSFEFLHADVAYLAR